MAALPEIVEDVKQKAEEIAGGPARSQVILVLAAVLGLDTADKATLSAVTGSLEQAFHVGNTEIGLLIAVVSFAGAICTVPIGILVDRISRRRILICATALWSAAMAVSGLAPSFLFMLLTRVFLGAITAAAWPSVASLSGDFFPPRDRGTTFGLILAGELVGTGGGFFLSGEISSFLDWRVPFFVMAAFGLALVWIVWRFLPEPARGGQSWLAIGQETFDDRGGAPQAASGRTAKLQEKMLDAGVKPRAALVLHEDPADKSLWWVVRYMVRIPTYVLLVIASSLGYFFFSGVRAFAMPYLTAHYGLSRSLLSALMMLLGVGAIGGVVLSGRIARWLLARGRADARIILPGVALLAATALLGPAFWTTNAVLGIGLLTLGSFMLGVTNPPIDAARLDIMHPRLWGRAESGRMMLRAGLEGAAPILFGYISDVLGGGEHGLQWAYMIMLAPLLVASSLTIPARRTYPRDVATAGASVRATLKPQS